MANFIAYHIMTTVVSIKQSIKTSFHSWTASVASQYDAPECIIFSGIAPNFRKGAHRLLRFNVIGNFSVIVSWMQYKQYATVQHCPILHSTWRNTAYWSLTLLVGSICSLPPAVRTTSLAFDVWSPFFLSSWPDDLELATRHSLWSDMFFWQFPTWFKNFSFLSRLMYIAH